MDNTNKQKTSSAPKIVGVVGRARSGKDTVADRLIEKFGFVRVAFADKLKEILVDAFDVPMDVFVDGEKKTQSHPHFTQKYLMQKFGSIEGLCDWFHGVAVDLDPDLASDLRGMDAVAVYIFMNNDIVPATVPATSRRLMQMVGTEGLRLGIRDSVLVDYLGRKINGLLAEGRSVVVSDIRRSNEFDMINSKFPHADCGVVGLIRSSAADYNHASENEVDDLVMRSGAIIRNNDTFEALYQQADILGGGLSALVRHRAMLMLRHRHAILSKLVSAVNEGQIVGSDASFISGLTIDASSLFFLSAEQSDRLNRLECFIAEKSDDKKQKNKLF